MHRIKPLPKPSFPNHKFGYMFLELLILIAILAILTIIALPNFHEKQIRAAVANTMANMRAEINAINAYKADWKQVPLVPPINPQNTAFPTWLMVYPAPGASGITP